MAAVAESSIPILSTIIIHHPVWPSMAVYGHMEPPSIQALAHLVTTDHWQIPELQLTSWLLKLVLK